jgi:hypothetical protein
MTQFDARIEQAAGHLYSYCWTLENCGHHMSLELCVEQNRAAGGY